jgi:hypothetical protein
MSLYIPVLELETSTLKFPVWSTSIIIPFKLQFCNDNDWIEQATLRWLYIWIPSWF